jgi:hypothetical protein
VEKIGRGESTYAADSSEATSDGGDFAGEELGEGHFSLCVCDVS